MPPCCLQSERQANSRVNSSPKRPGRTRNAACKIDPADTFQGKRVAPSPLLPNSRPGFRWLPSARGHPVQGKEKRPTSLGSRAGRKSGFAEGRGAQVRRHLTPPAHLSRLPNSSTHTSYQVTRQCAKARWTIMFPLCGATERDSEEQTRTLDDKLFALTGGAKKKSKKGGSLQAMSKHHFRTRNPSPCHTFPGFAIVWDEKKTGKALP